MEQKKLHRVRVKISTNDDGSPVYKWVQGKTLDELNDAIAMAYVSSGRIFEFMDRQEPQTPKVPETNFREYATEWFELYKSGKKDMTRRDYLYIMEHYLFPAFGDMNMSDITTAQIQALFNKWKTLAKSTINKMELMLKQIFAAALKAGKVAANPVDKELLENPSQIVNEREAIPEADYLDILKNLHKLELQDRRMIALIALTGMRRGEVLGLRWEDIHFERKLIDVKRNVTYPDNAPIIGTPKSKSGYRSIPLDGRLVTMLQPPHDIGYVIGGVDPISKSSFVKAMMRVNKAIDMHGATAHILRHTYATMLKNAGVPMKTIQYILGHADITTTMNIYTHTDEENVKQAGESISARLDSCEILPDLATC